MQGRKLLHGGDYNPEQWLDGPDILEQDIELMKKARVNTVTLGVFSWSVLEPEEGVFRLDWLADIIHNLYANGIRTILATPSAARPAMAGTQVPGGAPCAADRVRELYNRRQNYCYTSPVYREKVCIIDQKLAQRFGNDPAVLLWHISNEMSGDCHCELCQAAFRRWLKARYNSLEALNKAWNARFWSHDYTAWEQIESPAPQGENAVQGLALDWKRFVSDRHIDFLKYERDTVKEFAPDAKFTVNMMYRFDGIDYFKMSKEIDVASWDNYPTWHKPSETVEETALDTAMMHDLFYSMKDEPFLLMESSPSFTNWQPVSKQKKPGIAELAALQTAGHHVILVSSGAIAAGFSRLGFKKRPTKIADKQAAAAVGQGLLMEEYTKNLMAYQIPCAQILLNRSDFEDRRRYKNIFGSLSVLLGRGAIPIINENDTIAIEELKVGDNDTLSAQVAAMLHASLLILLTDIDGLYTANPKSDPNARHIDVVNEITPELTAAAGGAGSGNGTGGMTTKLSAASLATRAGVPVLICSSAEENNIVRAVKGTAKGTYFTASGHNMKTRLQWMAFYAPSAGNLYVDEGAAEALAVQAKSLLPKGIVAVEGDFKKGDVVSVFRRGSHEYLGKGIVNYDRPDLQKIMNESTSHTEAINRDNWIGAE